MPAINKDIFKKAKVFLEENRKDVTLAFIVFLISMLSFAIGYMVATHQQKEPLRIEEIGLFYFNSLPL